MVWKKGDVICFTEDVIMTAFLDFYVEAGEPCVVLKCNNSHVTVMPLSHTDVSYEVFLKSKSKHLKSFAKLGGHTLRNSKTKRKIIRFKPDSKLTKILF